jgi:excisionase family DNA binding protein
MSQFSVPARPHTAAQHVAEQVTVGSFAGVATSEADQPLILTVEAAARRLGVGRTTLYRLISTGEIETVSIGRLRRVPVDAVRAYVDRLRRAQGPRAAA